MGKLSGQFPTHALAWYLKTLIFKPYALADFAFGVQGTNLINLVGRSDSVRTEHFTICLDPADVSKGVSSSLGLYGTYEPEITWIVERLINGESTVIDVGANIGWYTLTAAAIARKVVSIEPEPVNFSLLSKSVSLNNFHNVVLRQEAISDRSGRIDLGLSDVNKGGHSIVYVGHRRIRVISTKLDDLVTDLGIDRVDLLKIDAESAEPQILSGFRNSLNAGLARNIVLEYSPAAWTDHRDLLRRLFDAYRVYEFRRPIPLLTQCNSTDRLPKSRQTMLVLELKL